MMLNDFFQQMDCWKKIILNYFFQVMLVEEVNERLILNTWELTPGLIYINPDLLTFPSVCRWIFSNKVDFELKFENWVNKVIGLFWLVEWLALLILMC